MTTPDEARETLAQHCYALLDFATSVRPVPMDELRDHASYVAQHALAALPPTSTTVAVPEQPSQAPNPKCRAHTFASSAACTCAQPSQAQPGVAEVLRMAQYVLLPMIPVGAEGQARRNIGTLAAGLSAQQGEGEP